MTIKVEFIDLLDNAISCADILSQQVINTDNAWMISDANTAKNQFQRIKTEAMAGKLPPSAGAGLGITRALGEWAPDGLYTAGKAVEDFYRMNWVRAKAKGESKGNQKGAPSAVSTSKNEH